ncbi:MAG: hypothetical protein ACR2NM_15460, partial [Bythopirellula sp.]
MPTRHGVVYVVPGLWSILLIWLFNATNYGEYDEIEFSTAITKIFLLKDNLASLPTFHRCRT